ncbi:unnamed protein product [Protopolystoma xenopodis]|uniref:Uncharacterized protein n=1 Tax=Protopolystoma xenopodis TaxID=117903 RepID=A0A3S4ZXA2_9PLAT|nr:unnamed protein product [Protopolystoma xenopodis]
MHQRLTGPFEKTDPTSRPHQLPRIGINLLRFTRSVENETAPFLKTLHNFPLNPLRPTSCPLSRQHLCGTRARRRGQRDCVCRLATPPDFIAKLVSAPPKLVSEECPTRVEPGQRYCSVSARHDITASHLREDRTPPL